MAATEAVWPEDSSNTATESGTRHVIADTWTPVSSFRHCYRRRDSCARPARRSAFLVCTRRNWSRPFGRLMAAAREETASQRRSPGFQEFVDLTDNDRALADGRGDALDRRLAGPVFRVVVQVALTARSWCRWPHCPTPGPTLTQWRPDPGRRSGDAPTLPPRSHAGRNELSPALAGPTGSRGSRPTGL